MELDSQTARALGYRVSLRDILGIPSIPRAYFFHSIPRLIGEKVPKKKSNYSVPWFGVWF